MCIKGDPVGFADLGGLGDDARILGEGARQPTLAFVRKQAEIGVTQ